MQLPPVDRFELNRMAHARAQELHLFGSPAGQSGHPQLHDAAMQHFGKRWSQLDVGEMRKLYDFLDSRGRLPKKGEL